MYGRSTRGTFLSKGAKEFRDNVRASCGGFEGFFRPEERLSLICEFTFARCGKNDISNRVKALEDALECAGVFKDDSQIDEIHTYRAGRVNRSDPHVSVTITISSPAVEG